MSVLFNNSKISINENEETNQIVIQFQSKPSAEIRQKLKFNNWRWNPYEKGWFHRKSDITLTQIESLKDIFEDKLLAPNEKQSNLSKEDYEYIHSDEFNKRFGEWEKAYRLEKLKESKSIEIDGKIILNGEDISEKIKVLRDEKNGKELQNIAKEVGRSINGIYKNNDTNENILVGMNSIKEIRRHHTLYENHIEAIAYIPKIIEKSILISEKKQTEKLDSPIIKFQYFLSGIKIKNEDYTVKSVIAIDKDGHRYYDQNLSEIEKGLFLTRLSRETSPALYKEKALSERILLQKDSDQLHKPGEIQKETLLIGENLSYNYDKRLIDICQCPQAQFLDENFEPTKEVIDMVRSGKTIDEIIQGNETDIKTLDYYNEITKPLAVRMDKTNLKQDIQYYVGKNVQFYDDTNDTVLRTLPVTWETIDIYKFLQDNCMKYTQHEDKSISIFIGEIGEKPLKSEWNSLDVEWESLVNRDLKEMDTHVLKSFTSNELANLKKNKEYKDYIVDAYSKYFTKKSMRQISDILATGNSITIQKEGFGDVDIIKGNNKEGLIHIIKRRYEARVLSKNGNSLEKEQENIAAITLLVVEALKKGAIEKTPRGNWNCDVDGIKAIINKDARGRFLLNGFDDNRKKEEATVSINAGIAEYRYTPEFLEMYAQVGAVIASVNKEYTEKQEKSSEINEKLSNLLLEDVMPTSQLEVVKELIQERKEEYGEESELIQVMQDLQLKVNTISKRYETDGSTAHPVALHYFGGSTDIYICEVDYDDKDTAFGYTILNGDLQNAEWGYLSLREIKSLPYELDFYVKDGLTIEQVIEQVIEQKNNEYTSTKENNLQILDDLKKEEIKKLLLEPAEKMNKPAFSRDTYNELFPKGKVNTPIGDIHLTPHQYERFIEKGRTEFIGALYQTLKNPVTIINEKTNKGNEAVFIKSFEDNDKNNYYIAISTYFEEGKLSVYSNGSRREKQVFEKIKKASSFYYVADRGSLISAGTVKEVNVAQDNTQKSNLISSESISLSKETVNSKIEQVNIEKTTQEEVENDRRTSNTRDDESEELQSDTQQESDVRNNRQVDDRGTQSEHTIDGRGSTEQMPGTNGTRGFNDVSNTETGVSEYSTYDGYTGNWGVPLGSEETRRIELESNRVLRSTESVEQRAEFTDKEINTEDYTIVKDASGQLGFMFDEAKPSVVESEEKLEDTVEQEELTNEIPPLEEQSTYHFEPTIGEDGIIDYTGVEANKILFVDKKHILEQDLPSYLPPIQIRRDLDYAIPACKVADNEYLLRGKDKDNVEKLYKVSLDVYAALTNYHLEYDRALVAINNKNKKTHDEARKAIEEPAIEEWEKAGYDWLVRKSLRETKEYSYKEYECYPTKKSRPSIPGKFESTIHEKTAKLSDRIFYNTERVMFQRDRNGILFRDHYDHIYDTLNLKLPRNLIDTSVFNNARECRKDLKQKMLDIKFMKEDYENTWTKGRETAYGDSKLDNELYEKYGVMVKRQNGNIINAKEKNELKEVLKETYTVFGDLSSMAKDFKLKVSHAGETRMHAMKAIGVFSVFQNAIGVSFDKDLGDPKSTIAHEFAHFIDHVRGKEHKTYFASDKEGTLENRIAKTFRSNMNDAKGDYWNRTCECFARAMEEYAQIEFAKKDPELQKTLNEHLANGQNELYNLVIDSVVGGKAYMDFDSYQKKVVPLVKELIEQNNTQEIDLAKEFNEKNKAFFEAIENYINNGIYPKNHQFILEKTPKVLQFLGEKDNEIYLSTRLIKKVTQDRHKLSNTELLSTLKQLSDPICIFDSDTHSDSKVLLTSVLKDEKPIIITIQMEKENKGNSTGVLINDITSIYDKTVNYSSGINIIEEWIQKDLLKYYDDKKMAELLEITGVQFPEPNKSANNTILTKSDFVNSLSAKKELMFTKENTKDLNQKFNDELQLFIDGKLSENHIFNFGKPNEILVNCNFPKDDNIELRASQLQLKSDTHEYDLDIVKNLPNALQNPIAVFKYGEENKKRNVIIEIQKGDRNFLVGVHFDQKRHNTIVSDIRGLFDKDTEKWLNWIEQGKLLYVNKEKIQTVIDQQRTNFAEVEYLNLESIESILSKHQNVNSLSAKKELMYEVCTIPEKWLSKDEIKCGKVCKELKKLNIDYFKSMQYFPPMEEKDDKIAIYLDNKNVLATPKQTAIMLHYATNVAGIKGEKLEPGKNVASEKMSKNFYDVMKTIKPDTTIEKEKEKYHSLHKILRNEVSKYLIEKTHHLDINSSMER